MIAQAATDGGIGTIDRIAHNIPVIAILSAATFVQQPLAVAIVPTGMANRHVRVRPTALATGARGR